MAKLELRRALLGYSCGDPIQLMRPHVERAIDAWAWHRDLADHLRSATLPSAYWSFRLDNLNHYNWCFWLVGLALTLRLGDAHWNRLIELVGGEGEDALLDGVIAFRSPSRPRSAGLLHPRPYALLLEATNAPRPSQGLLLLKFVEQWYGGLARPLAAGASSAIEEPYWHKLGSDEGSALSEGLYFGCWCIEAAAAALVFSLDDSLCIGHRRYPGDLIHSGGFHLKLPVLPAWQGSEDAGPPAEPPGVTFGADLSYPFDEKVREPGSPSPTARGKKSGRLQWLCKTLLRQVGLCD